MWGRFWVSHVSSSTEAQKEEEEDDDEEEEEEEEEEWNQSFVALFRFNPFWDGADGIDKR